MRKLLISIFIFLMLIGCSNETEKNDNTSLQTLSTEVEVSSFFESGSYTMIGEGRLGFIYDDSEVLTNM